MVVDKLLIGINEFIRGSYLENSLKSQLSIIDALDGSFLRYKDVPLLLDSADNKLSKGNFINVLDALKKKEINSYQIIVWLASSIGIFPLGSEPNALELLNELTKKISFD
tara:strand:- start:1040 stop:1369 length:330 start_codon:yes stop_codon:yes gene_type:complete